MKRAKLPASDKIDFAYQVLKERYDAEIARRGELDEKADRLIQCVTIVTGITIALGTSSFSDALKSPQLHMPYFIGIGLLISSMTIALVASHVMRWEAAPKIENILKILGNATNLDKMKENALMELDVATDHNSRNNDRKAKLVVASWSFMLAGLVTLVVFIVLFAMNLANAAN